MKSFSISSIAPAEAHCYGKLVMDYINHSDSLKPFYQLSPELSSFKKMIDEKSKEKINRKLLSEVLLNQYASVKKTHPAIISNIRLLEDDKSFTVCTGQQPCIFTGPLYFIYKIVSTLNLAKTLRKSFPDKNFIPVFWLATEDHDFAEINHLQLFGKKLEWLSDEVGEGKRPPVGVLNTASLIPLIEELKVLAKDSPDGLELCEAFANSYGSGIDLASATRQVLNFLFGEQGLVMLDGNDAILKNEFSSILSKELFENSSKELVDEASERLAALGYSTQIKPRPINLFYFANGNRERIEKDGDTFQIVNQKISFSEKEMKNELDAHPEKFSPNVVMRPLYQEKILPNLAYIGGPAEVAYWQQLKTLFLFHKLNFPVLLLRNSCMWIDHASANKIKKLGMDLNQLFKSGEEMVKWYMNSISDSNEQKIDISIADPVFDALLKRTESVDSSLKPAVEAERKKYQNSVQQLVDKIDRAKKKKEETSINQIWGLKEKLFPGDAMQERHDTLFPFYMKYGKDFIKTLLENVDPFDKRILVFTEKENQ